MPNLYVFVCDGYSVFTLSVCRKIPTAQGGNPTWASGFKGKHSTILLQPLPQGSRSLLYESLSKFVKILVRFISYVNC